MKRINILDCTLRDGGYINDWIFLKKNIKYILKKLAEANLDFIELGYYTNTRETSDDKTLFSNLKKINEMVDNKNKFLVMINYGEVDIENIPLAREVENIFGIRLAFHKKDMKIALDYCKKLIEKGYNVFVQPMVTMIYSEKELRELISEVNKMKPYAMYFVDSFGAMVEKDVVEKLSYVDNLLDSNIELGFHSHNNLQLSYSNVISMINLNLNRNIIIDSSVYGMGRGAGNLNSELILGFLNSKYDKNYKIDCLLEIADECLIKIKAKKDWGYNLEYYLSAINNCHPNYSKYFTEKQTVSISDLKALIISITDDKKISFDKKYAEELYINYMESKINDNDSYKQLKSIIDNKDVVLIGSGKSVLKSKDLNTILSSKNVFSISVNNDYDGIESDLIFISNKKKYNKINKDNRNVIITSNILKKSDYIVFDYKDNLANQLNETSDNALLLMFNILIKIGIKKVYLIGFDGFNYLEQNHYDDNYSYHINESTVKNNNRIITEYLKKYREKIEIEFITESIYEVNL